MNSGLPDVALVPTVPHLLRRAAERYGDRDFIVVPDGRISFAEAEQDTARLAKHLLMAGVGKGTRVGVLLPTGIEWALVWLAAARIGAMSMLFPATYRAAELRRALRIGDVALLVAQRTMLGKDCEVLLEEAVPSLSGHRLGDIYDPEVPFLRSIILMDGSDRAWATQIDPSAEPPTLIDDRLFEAIESEVSPADPLLVIYTSGSSADPKAVVHTHGATIRKVQPELGICLPGSRGGRTFCAMPFFWVGGPQDLLGALLTGTTVVTQERFDAEGALELLEAEHCNSITGWSTIYEQLRAHPSYPSRNLDALGMSAIQPMLSTKGDPRNLGMTETFGPHANREWFDYKVVDPATGETLPDGEEGEFCVRGFGLMAAMYKKEREEVFDPDGFYHTGDRGYIEDGQIWFQGRYSEMVKSGGANVSPLEVEQVLQSFSEVQLAFVVGLPDASRGEVVAAAVVPAHGAEIQPDELRQRANRELSAYKVPTRWLVLKDDDVPWLPSGKPNKRALRDLFPPP
jgi:acyl-CoA synthetase (AMP-forming)/AMP-acid ligase II